MVHEGVLLESKTLRASVTEHAGAVDALDKTKALSLLPDDTHVTTQMVASYFEVGRKVIESVVHDHRQELEDNGYRVLTGSELTSFKEVSSLDKHVGRHLALFTRRTVLNVAMLLRDSIVARQVRTYLLDTEARQSCPQATAPVDNVVFHRLVEWLDTRIAQTVTREMQRCEARMVRVAEDAVRTVIGQAVVPLLSHAVQADREHRRDVAEIRAELARIHRMLRARTPSDRAAGLDGMTPLQFEDHVAGLCRRDGCTDVVGSEGAQSDLRPDLRGRTAQGRTLVVRCALTAPQLAVEAGEMQKLVALARLECEADVALFTTGSITPETMDLAVRHGVTAVHRPLLESWSAGGRLQALS